MKLGSNLSGGQQQRVALARAAYAYSDLVLLDDPLSAVDPKIAEHIFHSLICGFLGDRTRILIAHQLPLVLNASSTIIYFGDDDSVTQFSPKEFMNNFQATILKDYVRNYFSMENGIKEPLVIYSGPLATETTFRSNDEIKSVGDVPFSVYLHYMDACGGLVLIGSMISLCVGLYVLDVAENLVLKSWMEMIQSEQVDQAFTLTGYIILMMLTIVMKVGSSFYSASVSLTAAQRLHDTMVPT